MQQYFAEIERKVRVEYSIAEEARKRGLDPLSAVEIPIATRLSEKVTGLVSMKYPQIKDAAIERRITELERVHGTLNPAVALVIAEEIACEKFCKFRDKIEAIDAGIRVGIAYTTLGVVSSPLEGFTELKLKKTRDGKDYFALYYSGPIRSAGGTAAAFSVVLGDYLRERFGYEKYDATEHEVKRAVTEIIDYHERITNLQYFPSEKEIETIARNLPVQIDGEPSEDREVSNYKDAERIETNFIRSGFCLVMAEGIAQKSSKLIKIIKSLQEKGFALSSWAFLQDVVKLQKKETAQARPSPNYTFIKDFVAGRPIFSHPSREGGFRLRYGRTRTSGYSAVAIHPATMLLLGGFIALGTQFRTERPGKSAAVVSCSSIEAPIIKTGDGSVIRVKSMQQAERVKRDVAEIIYLGDVLISYGDFYNRNHILMPVGYNEEYWLSELKQKANLEINPYKVDFDRAVELSKEFGIPLHPLFIFYWSQISFEQLSCLIKWLANSRISEGKIILPYDNGDSKRALEILGVEHIVATENIVIPEQDSKSLLINLGIQEIKELAETQKRIEQGKEKAVLEIINLLSKFAIRDRAGSFIGARMGRPEKAKLRKLEGSPHMLFPVGEEGGRLRSVQEACETASVKSDFPIYFCEGCNKETIYFICETCGNKTSKMYYCPPCERRLNSESCPVHGAVYEFVAKRIEIQYYVGAAAKHLNLQKAEIPPLVKGVRGTSSTKHTPENLAKGILRAMFNLNVNKDGTIRYDATELPITHFKPKEILTDLQTLRELGYTHDINGREISDEEQIFEIKPHDVILPACPDTMEENADDVFFRIANFIDNLLVRFYGIKPFYNLKSKRDLPGHLVACIAPHNSAAVVGRIIGFSKMQALLASPFMHAAMRRDCDGDEAAIMLLLDTLLNFSKEFLPAHRGGTQDAPLILNARLRAGEVDDMVFDIECANEFPIEFYRAAENFQPPYTIKISQIKDKINEDISVFKNNLYTHETDNINDGITCSAYKKLDNMVEKVQKQMELVEKIRAVDADDVAKRTIERHLMRDIRGNLRQFSIQQFRCVKCNEKYRRPPLQGNCLKCQGKLLLTTSIGGIIKYLEPAIQLATKYNVPNYLRQSLELTKSSIESIFGRDKEKQEALVKWF